VSPMSLVSFLPPLALSMLSEGPIPDTGLARDCAAAVLFVDISGFTRLADVATTRFGDKAAEWLQEILNVCFAPIVDIVNGADGQVLAFPGDAALCLWPVPTPDPHADLLREATLRAVRSGLELREQLRLVQTIDRSPLQFRAAVTTGPIRAEM